MDRTAALALARSCAVLAGFSIMAAGSVAPAATRTAPAKRHDWQVVEQGDRRHAEARTCADCSAALELRCVGGPGSGLLELALPVAGVANGREGASKQIRFIVSGHVLERRARTLRRGGLFVPHVALGADDEVFERLEAADLLELSFYGQRAYVGLGGGAQVAIHEVRARCWPDLDQAARAARSTALCTWHVPLGCFASQAEAARAGRSEGMRTLAQRSDVGWCANAVIVDLAAARIFAEQQGTYPRRRCVWVDADPPATDVAPRLPPADGARAPAPDPR